MQRNRPGLSNIETTNNCGNSIPMPSSYHPHTTTYSGTSSSLSNNNAHFYNQSQKISGESESVRSSFNPLRMSKGGSNFMNSMGLDAGTTTPGSNSFGQQGNSNHTNNFNHHLSGNGQQSQQQRQMSQQVQMSQHNPCSQNDIHSQGYIRFGNGSTTVSKDQNNVLAAQTILNSSHYNPRNPSKPSSSKIAQSQKGDNQSQNSYSRNSQAHASASNSNNNSNNFQNMMNMVNATNLSQNTGNNNLNNKLTIETTGESRPYSANNFTSYSATNSSAPMFGTKHALISSLNGGMTTKFNEKSSVDFSSQNQNLQQINNNLTGNSNQTSNHNNQRSSLQQQSSFTYQNNTNNSENTIQQQGSYLSNNQILSQTQKYQNGFTQQQNIRDESPSIKGKQSTYAVPGNTSVSQNSQPNNSFAANNISNNYKKSVGNSINFKEGISNYKQNDEQKRLSKSSQGHEIQRAIQNSQHSQQQQQQNQHIQQKHVQNNENISPIALQQSTTNQLKKQISLTSQPSSQQNEGHIAEPKQKLQNTTEPIIGKSEPLPNHEPTKCSFKRNGIVKAYAANTNQGLVRNYNEDRVSIILNIMKPASRANEQWPKCSFFGVYDGHGGVNCADFLRDNLHQFVIKESSFPWNPKEALKNGFAAAEKAFLELAQSQEDQIDRSGSCAIVILIVGDTCYVGNVGDSRAVLSGDNGQKVYTLSRDHKPTDELEQKRIITGGGKIYQTHATQVKQGTGDQKSQTQLVVGPLRVFPGRLSVSRTFGDIEAKLEKLGGNPNVVISEPEIKSFKITEDHDFIVLASDGVYDKMSSKEVIQSVWNSNSDEVAENIHKQCSISVEAILRDSLNKRSLDNVTVVMIAFNNYKTKLFGNQEKKGKQPLEERKNFQQPAINSADYSHSNKLEYNSLLNQGNKTATASSSQHYNGDFGKFSDKDFRKSLNITPNNRNIAGEMQLRKKFKENQVYTSNENYSYLNNSQNNNTNNHNGILNNFTNTLQPSSTTNSQVSNNSTINSSNSMHSQFNKLRLLDQKISEISNKVNQFSSFDRKINSNNR